MQEFKGVFVIVPAFKEEKYIGGILELLKPELASGLIGRILVVDDGSPDKTSEIVRQKMREKGFENLRLLRLPENKGKSDAFLEGLKAAKKARAQMLAVLDADSHACNPKPIERMLFPFSKDPRLKMVVAHASEGSKPPATLLSGDRAFRISAFNPYFAGNRLWRQMLEGKGFGLERAFDHFFRSSSAKCDALFLKREAKRANLMHSRIPEERRTFAEIADRQDSEMLSVGKIVDKRLERLLALKKQRQARRRIV